MPRSRTYSRPQIVNSAMEAFWHFGYGATSMDDLVRVTGVSRHGLYAEFAGKDALFQACLIVYSQTVVTPAFAQVEAKGATIADIEAYFLQQIALAETVGLPGPGCLMANTMTEVAPHSASSLELVARHNERLKVGFENALRGTARSVGARSWRTIVRDCAGLLVIFTNGLWSVSRTVDDGQELRRSVRGMLELISQRITR